MQFGYFTLSDNRYPNNPRQAEDFIKDIYAEALYAEKIGLNSAWIGEHGCEVLLQPKGVGVIDLTDGCGDDHTADPATRESHEVSSIFGQRMTDPLLFVNANNSTNL